MSSPPTVPPMRPGSSAASAVQTLHEIIPNVQAVVDQMIDTAATAKQYAAIGSLLAARDALHQAARLVLIAWEARDIPEAGTS